jgi:hypothetical protein
MFSGWWNSNNKDNEDEQVNDDTENKEEEELPEKEPEEKKEEPPKDEDTKPGFKPWQKNVENYNWFTRNNGQDLEMMKTILRNRGMPQSEMDIFVEKTKEKWEQWKETMRKDTYNIDWDAKMGFIQFFNEEEPKSWIYYKDSIGSGARYFRLFYTDWEPYVRGWTRDATADTTTGSGSLRKHCPLFKKKVVPTTHRKQVKVGRGLPLPSQPEDAYKWWGRDLVDSNVLRKNELRLMDTNFKRIRTIPLTPALTAVFEDIFTTGKINKDLLLELSEKDKQFFLELCLRSDVNNAGITFSPIKESDYERFELVRNEIMAGNNSPELLLEMKTWLFRLVNDKLINKKIAFQILNDINSLL